MEHSVNITAKNSEQFSKIEILLASLPEIVFCQIKEARMGIVGLECIIEYKFESKQRIFLPNGTSQISYFDDYIGMYCDNFFFKIIDKPFDRKFDFVILPKEKEKQNEN